jgi:hypothetical protein
MQEKSGWRLLAASLARDERQARLLAANHAGKHHFGDSTFPDSWNSNRVMRAIKSTGLDECPAFFNPSGALKQCQETDLCAGRNRERATPCGLGVTVVSIGSGSLVGCLRHDRL